MKKAIFVGALFVGAMFVSCSSDEPLAGPDNGSLEGQAGIHYLSVSIVSTPDAMGSRAGESETQSGPVSGKPNGAQYEDGTELENYVKKVRFYFFDKDGKASSVKAGTTVNYYDYNAGNDGVNMPNVEKKLKAILLIQTKEGDKLPEQMVAVVNPNDGLGETSLSLTDLRSKVYDYTKLKDGIDYRIPSFVMCNSVYANDAKQEVVATKITSENYQKTSELAIQKPIVVYVERNVAKVRVKTNLIDSETGLIKVQSKKDETVTDLTIDGTQVYVKLEGWNVTADLNQAYLSKHINPEWPANILSLPLHPNIYSNPWNFPEYFRSYWADACNAENTNNRYGTYGDAMKVKLFDGKGYVYCNENAGKASEAIANTKIIIPAMLCDKDGKALTLCEYYGVKFVDNEVKENDNVTVKHLSKLKGEILKHLQENGTNYYKKVTEGRETSYQQISDDDITFITVTANDNSLVGKAGAYYVIPCLTEDALNSTEWHTSNEENNTETIDATEINKKLKNGQKAKIWNSGKTYYYADIQHFQQMGVVRNHIYDINIATLFGPGTPVYNPDETIYPEKPVNDETYIAAQINILSWRVVPSNVNLEW